MFRHVWGHAYIFVPFVLVFCYMTTVAYSHGWLAVMFKRTWGWEVEYYAFVNGIALLVSAPVAVNFAGWLSDHWTAKGHRDAPMRIALLGFLLGAPPSILGPLMPNANLAFLLLVSSNIGFAFISATGVTALLNIAPIHVRAQTVALYYMAISLSGLLLGPTLVGIFNDYWFGTDGIRYSVALLPALFGIPLVLLLPMILRQYRKGLALNAAQTGS